MNHQYVCLNGQIKPIEDAQVSIMDRGLLYGDGLYETIRVHQGTALRLDLHMARLSSGTRILRLSSALANYNIGQLILSLLEANQLLNARVRVTITRGLSEGAGQMGMRESAAPTLIITTEPLLDAQTTPVSMMVSSIRRDETSPLCGVKCLNTLSSVLARTKAEDAGAEDAILLNTQGCLAEASTSNLFLVKGNRLFTPALDQGVLPGTSRAAVIALAPDLGYEVVETSILPGKLYWADELFLTNAIVLTRPIWKVNGIPVAGANRTAQLFREVLLKHVEIR